MTKILANGFEFRLDESDIINPDDMIPAGEYNPHNVRLWLLHDHGFTVCAVFADSLQDALDIAVNENKMDRYLIDEDIMDYLTDNPEDMAAGFDPEVPEMIVNGVEYWWEIQPAFLGNASEPFDIDTLGYVEIPAPTMSITALYGDAVQALSYHV